MSAEVHADGAPPPAHWRERRKQLESDLRLLQQDTLALSKAFEAASADLVSQEDCQDVLVRKLAEIRVRRMQEYLRVPTSAKMLFLEEMKSIVRRDHQTMPRREVRALLLKQWDDLTDEELETWETRFRSHSGHQGDEQEATPQKKPAAKLAVKTKSVKRKAAPAGTSPSPSSKKRKAAAAASTLDEPVAPSTPTKTRSTAAPKAAKKKASAKPTKAANAKPKAAGAKASKGGAAAKSSRTTASPEKASPMKGASTGAKARAATAGSTPAKKRVGALKKAATKKVDDDEGFKGAASKNRRGKIVLRQGSASESDDNDDTYDDDDDDDDDIEDDESVSSAGGSLSDDDSDDNMAQLPTGAFG